MNAIDKLENEMICRELLGWRRFDQTDRWDDGSYNDGINVIQGTPSFMAWVTAGVLLDRMRALGHDFVLFQERGEWILMDFSERCLPDRPPPLPSGPQAIRFAALRLIRRLREGGTHRASEHASGNEQD